MMKPLEQLCRRRDSVYDPQRRGNVLDVTDLQVQERVDPVAHFGENYVTKGMITLLEQGFRRLEGKAARGVFKLKQAMGGGKTHSLLKLGLS